VSYVIQIFIYIYISISNLLWEGSKLFLYTMDLPFLVLAPRAAGGG
jgi:hypothetical protein